MSEYWFKKRKSVFDYGRPANIKGRLALAAFIFFFALVTFSLGSWFVDGMTPPLKGVWLFAFLFIVLGGFLRVCNTFSPPTDEA